MTTEVDAARGSGSPAWRRRGALVPFGAAAFLLLVGFLVYGAPGHDDSHITYWAALTLTKTGEILNINGERVEQSSSIVHVLLLALLGVVTRVPIPTLGPLTSVAGGVAGLFATHRLAKVVVPKAPPVAAGLLATMACYVYWSFGGLETTLAATAFACLVITWERHLTAPSRGSLAAAAAATAFAVTVRPEGPVVFGLVGAALVVLAVRDGALASPAARRASLVPAVTLLALVLLESGALMAFRKAYFGAAFPNPVYAKGSGIAAARGVAYLARSFPHHVLVLTLAVVGTTFALARALERKTSRGEVIAALFFAAYLAFIVLVGGDWMTGARFFAHAAPVIVVLALVGLDGLAGRGPWYTRGVQLLFATGVVGIFILAGKASTGRVVITSAGLRERVEARVGAHGFTWFEIANLVHLRDIPAARALDDIVVKIRASEGERQVVIMTIQAGFIPYHLAQWRPGAVRLVDLCGIATRDFQGCVPAAFHHGKFGAILPVDRYFNDEERIDARCGTRRPDVVLWLDGAPQRRVLDEGYVIAYEQTGEVIAGESLGFLKSDYDADEWIAVDKDLAARAGIVPKPAWAFDIR